ncbi:hypothetical protein SMQE08_24710 [Serratia marcescens]|nr:hypothetical protein SME46J_25510 [Serratia marcescens]BEO38383.1 hypothetical protein SMQE08_24710 [Serratia marcescens]BEO62148.1 hypothetical protein SMQE30_25710 [Serratia marcescens]
MPYWDGMRVAWCSGCGGESEKKPTARVGKHGVFNRYDKLRVK